VHKVPVDLYTEVLPRRPGLGRHVEHDPQSRDYDIARTAPARINPVHWARHSPILDQGNLPDQGIIILGPDGKPVRGLGSCTGNGMCAWLACEPHCTSAEQASRYDERFAIDLYSLATQVDPWPGEWPPDDTGSSGNAVAKAARSMGYIRSWSWAFSSASLLRALQVGPVIVGVPWFEGMYDPDADGTVWPTGDIIGGHEFLIRGWDGVYLTADNSWGEDWGAAGSFRFTRGTWEALRTHRADVTVPHV